MKNVVDTLTLAQMRASPRRTLVTLAGVILSVAMLTAVFAGADSFLNLLCRQGKADDGIWEGKILDTGFEVVQQTLQDSRIEKTGLAASWGIASLDENQRWGAAVYGVNPEFYNLLQVECLEGSFPAQEGEMAITRKMAEKTGWKPGDRVTLDLLRVWTPQGTDDSGTMTYRQRSGFWLAGLADSYKLQELGNTAFTITAIVDPGGFANDGVMSFEPCFTVLGDQIPEDGLWCEYFTMVPHHEKEVYSVLEELRHLQETLPSQQGGEGTLELNRMLLLYHGLDYPGSMLLPAFYGLMGVVLIIILVGAVSLVRNAFSISMAERTRMLGMLASVGATKAQKRRSVLVEALILGGIGIPLGVVAGCGGMAIALPLVNQSVQELFQFSEPLYFSVRILPLAAAALLAVVTLGISGIQPAVAASRVSPMDAIRGEGMVHLSPKDLKTGKLTRKLFGFTGALALKNCKRNRRRYRAIVFSLVLSVVMLTAGSGLSYYVNQAMGVRYGTDAPLATATMSFQDPSLDAAQWTQPLEELAGKGEVRLVGGLYVGDMGSFSLSWSEVSQEARSWLEAENQPGQSSLENEESCTVYPSLLVMEDDAFQKWAGEKVILDNETLDCVLISNLYLTSGGSYAQIKDALNLPEGFSQEFTVENGFSDTWSVAALSDNFPFSSNGATAGTAGSLTLQLVTSQKVFQAFLDRQAEEGRFGHYYWNVEYLHPESISTLLKGLEDWVEAYSNGLPQGVTSMSYNSVSTGGLQRFGMLLQIFCTGFVVLLCLVCGANIHNILSTGMELRSREYAILRSIGVTPGKFRQMIRLESFFYGIKALCWGIPLGVGVLVLEYYAVRQSFYFAFSLPLEGILLAVVLVLGVCWASGAMARRRMEEETIVEAMRRTID